MNKDYNGYLLGTGTVFVMSLGLALLTADFIPIFHSPMMPSVFISGTVFATVLLLSLFGGDSDTEEAVYLLYYDTAHGSREEWNTFYTPCEVFSTPEERADRIKVLEASAKYEFHLVECKVDSPCPWADTP